jgi:hypothetical protein
MATTGIINGTLMRLYKDSTAIGYATSCQMNITATMREILTKDSASGGWREVKKGQLAGTLSTEALYAGPGDSSTNYLFDDLFTDLVSGTGLTIKFTTDVAGDNVFTMTALVTSLDLNAAVEENTSYSASFDVSGVIAKSVKA